MSPQDLEVVSLNYLHRLWLANYFDQKHTDNAWTWFNDEPACRNDEIYEQVKRWLVENNLVRIGHLSQTEFYALGFHPKEWPENWWFERTARTGETLSQLDATWLEERTCAFPTILTDARDVIDSLS